MPRNVQQPTGEHRPVKAARIGDLKMKRRGILQVEVSSPPEFPLAPLLAEQRNSRLDRAPAQEPRRK